MLFTELNTDVLLHIYGWLDPIDSINLAETCTRLRDVAQLYYKRFKIFNLEHFLFNERKGPNRHRHNRIDTTTVLKHIGPFIRDLAADLDMNKIGSDVGASIRKYCVNVKALKITGVSYGLSYNPYTAYSEWLKKLNLTKISLTIPDLFLIDLSETTTLEEFHCYSYDQSFADYDFVANIFERNVNISCLRIPLIHDFKYEIFEKLKCLKRVVLDVECDGGQLEKVATNLEMATLEEVELYGDTERGFDGLNEFLQKLSKNALHLKHLSVVDLEMATLEEVELYGDTERGFDGLNEFLQKLSKNALHLKHLSVVDDEDEHLNLYKEIPKMQPNLTLLDLIIYDNSDLNRTSYIGESLPKSMEQIIFLIKNLEKLEFLHIRFIKRTKISSTLKDFLQESVLCRIFDCHSIDRPTVTLRLFELCTSYRFVQVELDFGARKWTWTTMKTGPFTGFVERPPKLPFCDSYVETFVDLLAVQRFSGSASDLNAVKDEANKWIERLQ